MRRTLEKGEGHGRSSVIGLLLAANGLVFLVQQLLPGPMLRYLALWPLGVAPETLPSGLPAGEFHLWQLLSYAFLHGSLFHLAINMFVLWMFGSPLERDWGSQRFARYYVLCVLGAGAAQLLVVSMSTGPFAPTVGASGGVYALLLAFGLRYPNQYILLLIPPIPMKAKYFVIVIGLVELWLGIAGTRQGVAHFAHLAGMLVGLALILSRHRRP
ncbi:MULTISPECIES: rhomboid family intramembrane serine protease [Halomonas]|uniref:rhomboid family intramembrane serine protease n=1 Tax=Halomonas TaxID=2745 RepID=UPI0006144AA3|nr:MULTISPECIES: rhomboid family intramembrane serine protease [Halomonas]